MGLRNLRIRRRIMMSVCILTGYAGLIFATGIVATNMMHGRIEQIAVHDAQKLETALQFKVAALKSNLYAMGAAGTKDQALKSEYLGLENDAKKEMASQGARLDKLEDPKGKAIIEEMAGLVKKAELSDRDEAANGMLRDSLNAGKAWDAAADRLITFSREGINARLADARSTYRTVMIVFVLLGIAILTTCVWVILSLSKGITAPVVKAAAIAEQLAAGKLNIDIVVDRRDEFGDQATALKSMVEKWRDVVGGIKKASDSVASASVELAASAEQMHKGSGEQAEMANQVATASEEMSQAVLDISKNASSMASTATTAATTAREGGRIVEEAVKEVREIAETVGESESHITALAERSQRIGEIIGIINDIADQTNLLALNAAIEAARAGEHGRGFAVVADEVRKLAERTTGATSEVGGVIRDIQNKVESAVSSIEHACSKVERGVDLSTKAGSELNSIVGSVDELHAMVQQIATALEEMSATSDEVSRDVESISGVSKETSLASDEVMKASQELARLGTDLQTISKQFEV